MPRKCNILSIGFCCSLLLIVLLSACQAATTSPPPTAKPTIPSKIIIVISATPKPTHTVTLTYIPTIFLTFTPTITPTITTTPTETLIPPTLTLAPIPTNTSPPPAPAAVCDCSRDYNCSDFTTHSKAQECFNSCGGTKTNNWSRLDGSDKDGNVCESLP